MVAGDECAEKLPLTPGQIQRRHIQVPPSKQHSYTMPHVPWLLRQLLPTFTSSSSQILFWLILRLLGQPLESSFLFSTCAAAHVVVVLSI